MKAGYGSNRADIVGFACPQRWWPLVAKWIALSWIVVIFSGAIPLLPLSRRPWPRLVVTLGCLVTLTVSLAFLVGSPIDPRFLAEDKTVGLSEKLFVAAWWLLVARAMIVAGQIALRIDRQHRSSRLASDLAAAIVYLGAAIAILDLAFGVSVTGLIATSGIIAIVLGLALQSTLGDLFSGIAIGIDRPFKVGDVILIEGAVEGRVVETNWRSTRVATASSDIATVPNSVVAKSRITNRSAPSESHMGSVKIVLDPAVPPIEAIGMLRASVLNAALVSLNPAPTVACVELGGDGAAYEISFSAPFSVLVDARSDLLQQISRHARYSGVALARGAGLPIVPAVVPDPARLLEEVVLFEALREEDRLALAARVHRREGAAGEALFTQGGGRASLFVIARGAFEVTRDVGAGPRRVGTIGPGDFVGELSLLMGAPTAATVAALTPFVSYELTKDMIAPLLETTPDLLRSLEAAAARARTMLERAVAARACPDVAENSHALDRIRAFFGLKGHASEHLDRQPAPLPIAID
jgi:small-conductance mechanosensitive channel/CRP-like cAMP-binding protein